MATRIRIIAKDDSGETSTSTSAINTDENYEEKELDIEGPDDLAEGKAPTLMEFTNDGELRGLYAKESVQKAFEEIDEDPSKIPQYQNDADVVAVLKRIQAIFEPYIPQVPNLSPELLEQFAQDPKEVTRNLVETMGEEAAGAIVQQLQEAGLEGGGGGRGIDDIEAMMQQFGSIGGGMMGGMGGMMGGMGGMMGGMGGMMGGMGGGMMGGMGGGMGGMPNM